jgi:HlyD family secretion protein
MLLSFLRSRIARRSVILAVLAGGIGVSLVIVAFRHSGPVAEVAHSAPVSIEIVARGQIEPASRVHTVSGPADGTLTVIHSLLVDQGSKVQVGQVIAMLDGYEIARAALNLAQRNLELAELRLEQVKSGAKSADIAAQTNVVTAKQVEAERLHGAWERRSALYAQNFISRENLDASKAAFDEAASGAAQARDTLKSLTEIRSVDVAVAAAEVEVQKAAVANAEAVMNRRMVRAPEEGTVLSIEGRAGEAITADGILRMANLSKLIVVAQVDESQIRMVKLGMPGTIDGDVLPQPIKASVSRVAHEVFKQATPASDILVGRDAKIVEVELTPQTTLPAIVGGEVTVHLVPTLAMATSSR